MSMQSNQQYTVVRSKGNRECRKYPDGYYCYENGYKISGPFIECPHDCGN